MCVWCVSMCVFLCVQLYACAHAFVCVCVCVCVFEHEYMHMHVYVCVCEFVMHSIAL